MQESKVITSWCQSWWWVTPLIFLLCENWINTCAKMHLQGVPEYEWHPCPEMVIFVLDMKPMFQEPKKIWISCDKHFKFIICFLPMAIPPLFIRVYKCFLPLLVCGRDVKNLVTFFISHLEHMFHFQYVNLQG